VFEGIDDPRWDGGDAAHPLMVKSDRFEAMRKIGTPGERIV
jgi:putative proteasome-type protease